MQDVARKTLTDFTLLPITLSEYKFLKRIWGKLFSQKVYPIYLPIQIFNPSERREGISLPSGDKAYQPGKVDLIRFFRRTYLHIMNVYSIQIHTVITRTGKVSAEEHRILRIHISVTVCIAVKPHAVLYGDSLMAALTFSALFARAVFGSNSRYHILSEYMLGCRTDVRHGISYLSADIAYRRFRAVVTAG